MAEIKLDCPHCAGTGDATTGDRHAGTNMDTCHPCGGTGKIDAATGQSPEASFHPPALPTYAELQAEVEVLRRQRMAPERERELLEASNRHLQAERDISRAYVRLRQMIPGALDTPYAPTFEQICETTQDALRALLGRAHTAERQLREAPRFGYAGFQDGTFELIVTNPTTAAETTLKGALEPGQLDKMHELLPTCVHAPVQPIPAEGCYLVSLGDGGSVITAGLYEGKPAVFVEPTMNPRPAGAYTERDPGQQLAPGSLIFTCNNHVSGEVLLTYVLRMLARMEHEPTDDSEGFTIEAACHYGFEPFDPTVRYTSTDALYTATNAQIIALVKAARLQGYHDATGGTFQDRNLAFIEHVAADDPSDVHERMARFLEEALELGQALGAQRGPVHELVDYVFGRPVGEPGQEMGGTKVTLAGLAAYAKLDMDACGEAELERCNTAEVIAKIRGKRAGRPRDGVSLLPGVAR